MTSWPPAPIPASADRSPPTTPRSAAGHVGGSSPAQMTAASRSAGTGPSASARATRATLARRPPSAWPDRLRPSRVTVNGINDLDIDTAAALNPGH